MFFTDGKRRKKTHIPTTFFEPQILFSRTRNFYNSTSGRDKQKNVCNISVAHVFKTSHPSFPNSRESLFVLRTFLDVAVL